MFLQASPCGFVGHLVYLDEHGSGRDVPARTSSSLRALRRTADARNPLRLCDGLYTSEWLALKSTVDPGPSMLSTASPRPAELTLCNVGSHDALSLPSFPSGLGILSMYVYTKVRGSVVLLGLHSSSAPDDCFMCDTCGLQFEVLYLEQNEKY